MGKHVEIESCLLEAFSASNWCNEVKKDIPIEGQSSDFADIGYDAHDDFLEDCMKKDNEEKKTSANKIVLITATIIILQ